MRHLFKKKAREFYARFLSLKGHPREIAMGMAIGVFVGVTPTIPFHTLFVLLLIFIFRQNLTAALLGAWITNPLTIPIFYITEYELGRYILGWKKYEIVLNDYTMMELLRAGWDVFCPLQVGGLALAPFFALPAYVLTYKTILAIRKRNGKNDNDEGPFEEVRDTSP